MEKEFEERVRQTFEKFRGDGFMGIQVREHIAYVLISRNSLFDVYREIHKNLDRGSLPSGKYHNRKRCKGFS